jgi:DNA-binding CsgD family transcriptional regulator
MTDEARREVIIPSIFEVAATSTPLIDQVRIKQRREGLIDAYVPLDLIFREEVPVDSEHVMELSSSMGDEAQQTEGSSGQLSPILLAEIPGEPKFPIVDGFHRTSSLYDRKEAEAYSTIMPGMTWDRVFDLRILTATTHRSVRFARVVEWVNSAWSVSPWADKLDATQAFAIASNTSFTGKHLDLDQRDFAEIKEWAREKCLQWKLSQGAIYKSLYTASTVDPDLIKETREGKKGRGVQKVLTQQQVTNIGTALPHRYEIQRVVANAAKSHSLSSTETLILAESVRGAESAEDALDIVQNTNLHDLVHMARKVQGGTSTAQKKRGAKEFQKQTEALHVDSLRLAKMSLQLHVLKGIHIPAPLNRYSQSQTDETSGLDVWPSVWNETEIDKIVEYLEAISPAMERSLGDHDYDSAGAKSIVKAAGARIIADIRMGVFKYVEDVDSKEVQRTYAHTVRDEIERRRAQARSGIGGGDQGSRFTLWQDLDSTGLSQNELSGTIRALLPQLNTNERQILILSGVMNLTSFVISRTIGTNEAQVAAQVKELTDNIKSLIPGLESFAVNSEDLLDGLQGNTSTVREIMPLPETQAQIKDLTDRELEIMRYVQEGLANSRIANMLWITEQTVKFHLSNTYRKLGVKNRTQAVQVATSHGILVNIDQE